MAHAISAPVYLRIGGGAELQIGDIQVPVDGNGSIQMRRAELAAALRSAADNLDTPPPSDVPGGGQ